MKTFEKVVVCIIVVLLAIGVSYLIYSSQEKNINNTNANVSASNISQANTNNELYNNISSDNVENTDYVGEEEKTEFTEEKADEGAQPSEDEQETELTGKDKAIDIVKKQYAVEGQTVRFDHMEGTNYIVKINDGTAVTWYLVDGTTWEAEEY